MKLLDTSAWVEYFKGTPSGVLVKTLIQNNTIYTSAITLAEISKWVSGYNGNINFIIAHIKKNSIILLLDELILVQSGKNYALLRKVNKKISLIDVIIYTSAVIHDLTLVTCDRDFKGLADVDFI